MSKSDRLESHIGHPLHLFESIDSTNNYAMEKISAGQAAHGTVYMALEQTAGKGQRGKHWVAAAGCNIMISLVLDTTSLELRHSFSLSAAMALGCYDFLNALVPPEGLRIKWPNDIYFHDRKAGGILIENRVQANAQGPVWVWAVVGIGININQTQFPDDLAARATSLRQITGKEANLHTIVPVLCTHLDQRWKQLHASPPSQLLEEYNRHLYKKNTVVKLRHNGRAWETMIREVDAQGCLVTHDTMEHRLRIGEVEWL